MKEQGHTEEEEEREGKRWPGGAGGAARGGDSATQLGLWASFPPGTCLCLSHPLACELLQAQKVSSLSRVQLFVTLRTVAYRLLHPWDFPGKSTGVGCHFLLQVVKHPPANTGRCKRPGLIPGSGGFSWKKAWQPVPVSSPGRSHTQRSLAGYSP